MVAQLDQASDRGELQRQLLLEPNQSLLWSRLQAASSGAVEPAPAAPAAGSQLPRSTSATAPGQPRPARTPNPAASNRPASSATAITPGSTRPWQRRFHPVGSPEATAVLQRQLQEFQSLVEAQQFDQLLRRLDHTTAPLLADCLSPDQAYALGHRAFERELYPLAAPLLKRAAAAGEAAGDLLPWSLLFHGLTHRGLGELAAAQQLLESLLMQAEEPGQPSAWPEAAVHAQIALAWLHLNRGAADQAAALLTSLRESPLAAGVTTELDLLGRVLSTLEWLAANPRDTLSHTVDRAASCGLMAALDAIKLSPCGGLLQIRGWLVDPGQQLKELCVVRGNRVWRLDLGQARYTNRPDLTEVILTDGHKSETRCAAVGLS